MAGKNKSKESKGKDRGESIGRSPITRYEIERAVVLKGGDVAYHVVYLKSGSHAVGTASAKDDYNDMYMNAMEWARAHPEVQHLSEWRVAQQWEKALRGRNACRGLSEYGDDGDSEAEGW